MNIINSSLVLIEIILVFILIYKMYKKYDYNGLYFLVILCTILANVFMVKKIEIFTLEVNIGIILNLVIYIIANIIVQKKGQYAISSILILVFISTLFSYVILTFSGLIASSSYNEYTNIPYSNLFEYNIQFYLASLFSLFIGLTLNSRLYYFLKKTKNKVWISNILSTIIVQFFEAIIFVCVSYVFKLEVIEIIFLIVSRYIIRTIVGIISTVIISPISKIDD